jgi:uncharacterized protein YegP (UPF0339 family)
MKFEVYRDKVEKWRWRLIAANESDILADSGEGYANLEDCYHAIKLVRSSKAAVVLNVVEDKVVIL